MSQQLALALPSIETALAVELDSVATAQAAAVRHAWRAGDLLTQARRLHKRGTWLPWLQERGLTPRTAQRLLALRRSCPTEADAIDAGSITRALAAAREARLPLDETIEPTPAPVKPTPTPAPPVETVEVPEPAPPPSAPLPSVTTRPAGLWQRIVRALRRLIGL